MARLFMTKTGRMLGVLMMMLPMCGKAVAQEAPQLEYVCELRVTCDAAMEVGPTAHGRRVVIPITGGTFEGPRMRGVVLSGGADYQLVCDSLGRTELEAIYCIRTDDGVTIHIRNAGVLTWGKSGFYFRTLPHFEAPVGSAYEWLNNAIFVCVPEVQHEYISLKVWMVK